MRCRGQSLVELAVALPAVLALVLGSAALVRLADAKSGLDAATAAAVAEAVRQTSGPSADQCAKTRFAEVAGPYGFAFAGISLGGTFTRGSMYRATGSGWVDLSFVPLWFVPHEVRLASTAQAVIEPWRSRAGQVCPAYARASP